MITRKLDRKNKQMQFYIDGKLAAAADLDPADIARVEAELTAKLLKAVELHG